MLWVWGFFIALPFAAGRAVGVRVRMNTELRANSVPVSLIGEQRQRASLVAGQERARIARELHDAVAHSVSVMVIQTAAARRVAAEDATSAREALQAVESCGRDALVDLRRMIGVLERSDFEGPGGRRRAGAAGKVGRTCSGVRLGRRGLQGEPRPLPPALDLVSFRIVQEALTNAIKHAGPVEARVCVTFTDDYLVLEISDTGRSPSRWRPSPNGGGLGLVGMQERLSLYGGDLETGPRRGSGFEVRARLPLPEAAGAE